MIKQESRAYFRALGAYVTTLRKSRGMTQAELARAIGVSQQAVFSYELGERRISVLVLAKLAKIFSTPVEDMIGLSKPLHARKGPLSPRCMRHAERLQALPKTQQTLRHSHHRYPGGQQPGKRAMTSNFLGELRKQRERLTKQALADVVRLSIFRQRIYQTNVSRRSGVSRSHIRAILRAEKCPSLFIFLELSCGLSADPFELLRNVLDRRDELSGLPRRGTE